MTERAMPGDRRRSNADDAVALLLGLIGFATAGAVAVVSTGSKPCPGVAAVIGGTQACLKTGPACTGP